jgi:hypothetical protein
MPIYEAHYRLPQLTSRGTEEATFVVTVKARCWYDAREWARGKYGDSFIDICNAHPDVQGWEYEAPAALTLIEIAREHTETLERRAYAKGRANAVEEVCLYILDETLRCTFPSTRAFIISLVVRVRKKFGAP